MKNYLQKISKLRRDHKNGGAPHKPVLLLAVLEEIAQGRIRENKIELTPELVQMFKSIWADLVTTNHSPLIALPFFHMKSEGFWHLIPKTGFEKSLSLIKKSSLGIITNMVSHVELDQELFQLFKDSDKRAEFNHLILTVYFPDFKNSYKIKTSNTSATDIINEDPEVYGEKLQELQLTIEKEAFEEELFVRSALFKREVPKIYNYTCAVSGWQFTAVDNISMLDACHIMPFAQTYNDSLQNGIALSPNIHRAFDRGILNINENYEVELNRSFKENINNFSLKQFEGKQIHLPNNKNYWPSTKLLLNHKKLFE